MNWPILLVGEDQHEFATSSLSRNHSIVEWLDDIVVRLARRQNSPFGWVSQIKSLRMTHLQVLANEHPKYALYRQPKKTLLKLLISDLTTVANHSVNGPDAGITRQAIAQTSSLPARIERIELTLIVLVIVNRRRGQNWNGDLNWDTHHLGSKLTSIGRSSNSIPALRMNLEFFKLRALKALKVRF